MTKRWEDMDPDEKCDVLRAQIKHLTDQLNVFSSGLTNQRKQLEDRIAKLEKKKE